MTDLDTQLRDYFDDVVRRVDIDEIADGPTRPHLEDTPFSETEAPEPRDADLIDYVPLSGKTTQREETATASRKWTFGVVAAVAAAILLVVGIVIVVADRDGGGVVTDPAAPPNDGDPVSPPSQVEPVPPPSVVDSLGYRWSRVPNDAVFGGEGKMGMNSVVVGGPGLVAVGEAEALVDCDSGAGGNAAVWTSLDGFTWSRVSHDEAVFGGDDGNYGMHTVIAGGPGLVAIGGGLCSGYTGTEDLWTSGDGLSWQRISGDVFTGGGPNDLTAGGPGLVAVGENNQGAAVWTSVDGLAWSRVPHDQEIFGHRVGDGNGMTGVTVGGPGLVAVGSDGLNSDAPTGRASAVVWTSVDGLTWSRVPHDEAVFGGEGDQGMFDVAVGGPGLVAVGENDQGAPIWTSVDGLNWSRVPNDETVFKADTRIGKVIATDAGLVAVGSDGILTSTDGITWALIDDEAVFGIADLTVGGPGLVAVGGWPLNAAVWVATLEG